MQTFQHNSGKQQMNTERLMLFGAGKAGTTFIKRNSHKKILAVADNDPSRWGQVLHGIPVIDPATLFDFDFDQLVITSQWIDSIQSQLIHQIKLPQDKIRVPAKHEVKAENPFQHPPTLELAQETMVAVSKYLEGHGVTLYLDSGTLLGLIRNGNLIPWDDDVDFAINSTEFPLATQLMANFLDIAPRKNEIDWKVLMISQGEEDVCINIEFEPRKADAYKEFDISLQMRQHRNGRSELVSSAGIFDAASEHFTGHEALNAFGHIFSIPNKAEEFLSFMYGDWKKPRPAMAMNDYNNRYQQTVTDSRSIKVTKRTLLKLEEDK